MESREQKQLRYQDKTKLSHRFEQTAIEMFSLLISLRIPKICELTQSSCTLQS